MYILNYFNYYQVFESESENGSKDLIATYTDASITSHSITDFNPNIQKWFWVSKEQLLKKSKIFNIQGKKSMPPEDVIKLGIKAIDFIKKEK